MSNVKRNIIYQIAYEILVVLLPLITSPYISRVLGAEKLGIYSYTYSIAYYFQLFSMLGIKFYGNRIIATVRDDKENLNKTFSQLIVLHIFFSIISFVFYCIYTFFGDIDNKLITLIQSLVVISSLFDISWLFFGLEKFKITVTRNTIIKVCTVILIFIFVRTENDLWKYTLIMSVGIFLSQLTLWPFLKRYVRFQKITFTELLPHIKPLFILFIPIIALSLFKYMDKIMLGLISSKTQLGYYENADKAITIPTSVIIAFGSVMLPRISNLEARSLNNESKRYMKISMKYIMWLAIGMTFGLAGVSREFAPIFWGKEFIYSGFLIQLLAISIPFSAFANIVRTQCLIPTGKDKLYSIAIIGGAVVNLVTNLLLIPSLQSLGVTIGTILAEITVCSIQLLGVYKEYPFKEYFKSFRFFGVPGIIMYIFVKIIGLSLETTVVTLLFQIFIGGSIYIIMSFIYMLITGDEFVSEVSKKYFKRIKF